MRKPVSKHALRRAMERAQAEGIVAWEDPTGTVVDRIWHLIEREAIPGARRKPVDRDSIRTAAPAGA